MDPDCLSSLCWPYSPELTHASLPGDLLKMSQSTVLCHTPRPLIMLFIKKIIPSELTPPHTSTMPNKMKGFHKHRWDEQMGSLDCIYALRGILQGYWKMLNLNIPELAILITSSTVLNVHQTQLIYPQWVPDRMFRERAWGEIDSFEMAILHLEWNGRMFSFFLNWSLKCKILIFYSSFLCLLSILMLLLICQIIFTVTVLMVCNY